MSKITQETWGFVRVLWDYLVLNQPLVKSDCILVFGGHDPSVAVYASELYRDGWASNIIVSGGVTHPAHYYGLEQDCIEAEALKKVLLRENVPENSILLETKAKNTSENFWFTDDLLKEHKLPFHKFILMQKPYTERRTYLTGLNRWKDKSIIVSSIKTTFDEYINCGIEHEKIINMMTGEVYRILEYPKLGYFTEQDIPVEILDAYNKLLTDGFDSRIKRA